MSLRESIIEKRVFAVFWALALVLYSFCPSLAQEVKTGQEAISAYQKHRLDFVSKQKSTSQSYQDKATSLQKEINLLQKEISGQNSELAKLSAKVAENEDTIRVLNSVQLGASSGLFPVLSAVSLFTSAVLGVTGGRGMILIYFFLSLTMINTLLYLYFKEKPFYAKYKRPLIIACVLLICMISSPLLADDLSKREEVINQLKNTAKVLSLSDHQRFIAILESKANPVVDLPSLESGNPLFEVFRQVYADSPEYWFTLAALYTHEQQNGKALDAVKQITQGTGLRNKDSHRMMFLNSITYLLQQNQTEPATAAIDSLSEGLLDVTSLLKLADVLQKNSMQPSAEKVLGYSINKANSVPDLIKLASYLIDNGKPEKGTEALAKALSYSNTAEDLLLVAETAIATKKDPIIAQLVQKTGEIVNDYAERMRLIDLLLKNSRKEEAVMLFKGMVDGVTPRTKNNTDALLYLIDAALQRDLLPQAISATGRLYLFLGSGSETFNMELKAKLKSSEGIPDEDKIMLPQFYGLINEEQQIYDEAEAIYIKTVLSSLSNILKSYGYELPKSLNNFYLLGRIWVKNNQGDLVGELDHVYGIIEEQFLKQQSLQNEKQIEELQNTITELRKSKDQILTEVEKKKVQVTVSIRRMIEHLFSVVATIIFLIAALIGCLVIAGRYSKTLTLHKTYGFFWKFIEASGWLQVLSILSCITGVIQVIFSQFFQIFCQNQENTRKLCDLNTHSIESGKN